MTTPSPLESRLERVERLLDGLSIEVAAIRAELGTSSRPMPTEREELSPSARPNTQVVAAAHAVSPRHRLAPPPVSAKEIERLVGSYGMLAIAVLAAVAAVGTF